MMNDRIVDILRLDWRRQEIYRCASSRFWEVFRSKAVFTWPTHSH